MNKQVILLAGLHKTATTSIQATCFAHQKLLREAGFFYPGVSVEGTPDANHSFVLKELFRKSPNRRGLAGQFAGGDKTGAPIGQERRRERFAAGLAQQPGRLLLAAEGVSVFSEEELRGMKEWFANNGLSLRVICNVRHLSGWIQSMVAQRVVGMMGMTISEAVREFADFGGIVRPRIEAIRRTFPEAEFYSHEASLRHPAGPVGFFFDVIGFQTPLTPVRANEGRSDAATRTVSLINEQFGRSKWLGSPDDLEKYLRGEGLRAMRALPGPKFMLTRGEVEPIFGMLEQENKWLRDTLGDDFHDGRMQFEGSAKTWTPESIEIFSRSLARLAPAVQAWVGQNLDRLEFPDRGASA